jgi:hypothetical protein
MHNKESQLRVQLGMRSPLNNPLRWSSYLNTKVEVHEDMPLVKAKC